MPDTWNGTTGNWIDETSWSDGAVLTAGDVAEINASFAQAVASETFRPGTNDILVNNFLGGHIADIRLVGGGYSANEFSLSNNTLVYTASHSA